MDMLIQPRIKINFVHVKIYIKSNSFSFCLELKAFQGTAYVIFTVGKHVNISKSTQTVALTESVSSYLVHGLVEKGVLFYSLVPFLRIIVFWSQLFGIKLRSTINWFYFAGLHTMNVDDVDIKRNVSQKIKFSFSLNMKEKLFVFRRDVLEPVPSITFECIKHVVICINHAIMIVK